MAVDSRSSERSSDVPSDRLAVRLKNEKPDTAYTLLSTIETKFRDNGFTTRRAGKEDLKRLLAIYFEQNTTTERFEDYDGQRFLEVI